MKVQPLGVALAVLVFLAAGCDGDDGGGSARLDARALDGAVVEGDASTADPDASPTCRAGTALCPCLEGACPGAAGLTCVDDVCIYPGCDLGEEGCACRSNGACDLDEEGARLVCEGGLCVPPECPIGAEGCACAAGNDCLAGLTCVEQGGAEICAPEACPSAGGLDCPCRADRGCDEGLACVLSRCVDPGLCDVGAVGCPCQADRGCDDGLTCDATSELCAPIGCTPGSVGCECDAGQCDGADVVCLDGQCAVRDCPNGQEGCACLGERCGVNDQGEALTCSGGICQSNECPAGAAGCVCRLGADCDDAEARCEGGYCFLDTCVPGEEGCPCAGFSCAAGLVCQGGLVCVDGAGATGGPCLPDDTCERGNRCAGGLCVSCYLGTTGCGCDDAGGCVGGALRCDDATNTCVEVGEAAAEPIATIPENPLCYTSCKDGLTEADGTYRVCGADGLMDGCVGETSCVEGSCVKANEAPPACEGDANCPDHQACMEGQCYSNCLSDEDCGGGAECYRRVCRMPCGDAGDCNDETTCEITDTVSGYCMPNVASTTEPQKQIIGDFEVTPAAVSVSNVSTSFRVTIKNNSPAFQRFAVRKFEHQAWFDDGTSQTLTDNYDDVLCDPLVDCPLFWLEMAEIGGDFTRDSSLEVLVEAGGEVEILVQNAGGSTAIRWLGTLEIISEELGARQVTLVYAERPDGQWRGTAYYYSSFSDENLADWAATPESRANLNRQLAVKNAFVQRWSAFRSGRMSWDEMDAVMTATESGAWVSASELDDCSVAACYLYNGSASGVGDYSSALDDTPIPMGVTELPFAMNLLQPEPAVDPGALTGRIESSGSLHYAGNPAVSLSFRSAPDSCDLEAFGACLAYVDDFEAEILVGGRYRTTDADASCAARGEGYTQVRTPWLVPGFDDDTYLDAETGNRYRYECRDALLPYDAALAADPDLIEAENRGLATSNPIPDGRTRRRTLRLLDGALVNGSTLIILFEERMDSFMDPTDEDGIAAYGYLVLEKQAADLGEEDANNNLIIDAFEGNAIEDTRDDPDGLLDVACDAELLDMIPSASGGVTASNAADVISTLIYGVPSGIVPTILGANDDEQVHYYCEDTGLIDGGPDNDTAHGFTLGLNNNSCAANVAGACQDGGYNATSSECDLGTDLADCGARYTDDADTRVACPAGSEVIFFTVDADLMSQAEIAALPCQETGGCLETLNAWRNAPDPLIQEGAIFRCADGGAYCDRNRYDLRDGKEFFAVTEDEAVLPSFRATLEQAFRYKTRFQSRTGASVGFAPEACLPDSDQIPYCYDAEQIGALRARVDCLLSIWEERSLEMMAADDADMDAALEVLDDFLAFNFGAESDCSTGACRSVEGFEKLRAELLIMMGDEAFTDAFSSRFDLAGSASTSFEGALFEEGGVNLSGIVGYEMYALYKATQYYQEALDRFYALSPMLWLAVTEQIAEQADPDADHRVNFVTPETVTDYLERLMRASTQKARAWSRIATRYQALDRADLASDVVERAYTATYLESAALSRLMQRIRESFLEQDRPQIEQVLENSQRRYRMALLEMRDVYNDISEQTNVFGLEPDYVPFPALTSGNFYEDNAFEKIWLRAWDRTSTARAREDTALESTRSFETDTAAFQSELARIRNTYEAQLGELCGTFVAEDGRVYPAIKKYAALDERTHRVGDPCGFVGNGSLYEAMVQVDIVGVEMQELIVRYGNVLRSVETEQARVAAQCALIDGLAAYVLCAEIGEGCEDVPADAELPDDTVLTLENQIRKSRFIQTEAQRALQAAQTIAELTKCSVIVGTSAGGDCATSVASRVLFGIATVTNEIIQAKTQTDIDDAEEAVTKTRAYIGRYQTESQCDQMQIDSAARMQDMLASLKELDLQVLRSQYQLQLALSQIQRIQNEALRLQLEQDEVEQMTINVEAARNDPNIRLYRNDAVINADFSFEDALTQAYRATRAYEYYTSQSYEQREELYLIRMIAHGDYNLENYLIELQNAFSDFEEELGAPALRVEMLSLRDDILNIPLVDEDGISYGRDERTGMLRAKLRDVALLDRNGYLTIPFSTSTKQLSPLTRNHKLSYVEVDIVATDYGDQVARVYLRQLGTGTIHTVEDETQYYRFPDRTAVINAYFGGTPFFDAEVYKNYRLRDRPFSNTAWELVINQRDEPANQDLDLQKVSDIRLFIYYTDFTNL